MNFGKIRNAFGFALTGIVHLLKSQQNFRIELTLAIIAVIAGFYLSISPTEWLVLCICTLTVLATEALNTAIEEIVDLIQPEQHPQAGLIKDIAAGAVFIVALGALVCGCLIFLPKIL